MTENKPKGFEGLVATAKTLRQIQCSRGYYECKQVCPRTEEECRKEMGEWVSLGAVLQLRKQLRQKALDIDKSSNDYAEVCKQNRQYRSLLREVFGSSEAETDSPSHRLLRTCCPSQYDRNEESSIYYKKKEGDKP